MTLYMDDLLQVLLVMEQLPLLMVELLALGMDVCRRWNTRAAVDVDVDVDIDILPPFQIIVRLAYLIPSLTTHLIQIIVQNIIFFLLWLVLLI